ncbi:hypothetical protein NliqN6_6118 [Naganishia liquefaciens]|uniref:Uncharacterized protein n=1 Tax=Naganishia liquefaciens TaxID=104408 RepID=A0A8H3TY28_9TREE|nr:hypothetical protein NliqN6_6118 [Naganishia liquefaciens]
MFDVNRNLDDPNNAEITPEQIEELLNHHGHIGHDGMFGSQNLTGEHYLYVSDRGASRSTSLLEGSVHVSQNAGINQLLVDALLERDEAQYHINNRNGAEHIVDLHGDLLGEGDGLFVEEQPGSDSASAIYTSGDISSAGNGHLSKEDHSLDDADFEIAVDPCETQEQDVNGEFLPEADAGDVEIATEHLHLAEDVAFFTTRAVMDNSHERLIDDDTLNRLKEEMRRMDQEKSRIRNDLHTSNDQSSRNLPLQANLAGQTFAIEPQVEYTSVVQSAQSSNTAFRDDSLSSVSLLGRTPRAVSANDSDASPQSEASGSIQQKQMRRHISGERRDSAGSSGTRGHTLIPLCEETGKRMMMKDRMDQLARLIRNKMRSVWGVAEDEPLPGPEKGGPDWSKGSKHPDNVKFQEEIAGAVFHQLLTDRTIVIPESQRNLQAAKLAATVSFNNFCKRYAYQTDERWKAKSARDAKRGRRWARKDLKQKKRLRASARLEQQIPQQILRMEYMSSEDSSEGEDSGLQEGTWQLFADLTGRASADEKVVEVKTPRWRSAQLQGIYDRLDEIAATQTLETKGKGYSHVPLRRFKLDELRPKNPPKTAETWMFVDGIRPPPLPRKARRPNDTAKRRAEEGPARQIETGGDNSKRTKDDLVPEEGRSIYQSAQSVTLEDPSRNRMPARPTPHHAQETEAIDSLDYDLDIGLFDDRPFDTIEENEHYREEESDNTAQNEHYKAAMQ